MKTIAAIMVVTGCAKSLFGVFAYSLFMLIKPSVFTYNPEMIEGLLVSLATLVLAIGISLAQEALLKLARLLWVNSRRTARIR